MLMSLRCYALAAICTLAFGSLSGCGGGGGNSAPGPTVTNLVTFWTFDTAVGARSPAVYAPGLDAVLYSASIAPGKFGNALKLDATLPSSYAVLNVLSSSATTSRYLDFSSNEISVAMWVQPDSLKPNATYHLFGNGYYGVKTFRLLLVGGKITFDLYNANTGANDLIISSQTSVPLGTWTHIAVSYDGNTAKIYINGNIDASNSISHPVANEYNDLYIGGVADASTSLTFPGSIDELLLASGRLSADQVIQLISGYRPQP